MYQCNLNTGYIDTFFLCQINLKGIIHTNKKVFFFLYFVLY